MAVGLRAPESLAAVPGVRLGTARAGLAKGERDDVTVLELAPGSAVAAVFTRNRFCAAPVTVARQHLAETTPRYLLVNAGNANAGTGARGLADARAACAHLAGRAGVHAAAVLPFSTGVIGEPLAMDRFLPAIDAALEAMDEDGWLAAARAIMTTDTLPKGASRTLDLAGGTVTLTGIAKGAGMIRPDMATMLAFLATDARIPQADLQAVLAKAVEGSFNRITVDGDTSTNDACVLAATGRVPVREGELSRLAEAVADLCRELAQAIVRDGEGATRFVTVTVAGGECEADCLAVAYTIAHSPLVKTALFAGDPNWGRILAALGRAPVARLDLERVTIHLDEVCIVRGGGRAPEYTEADGQRVMVRPELTIRVDLGDGEATATVWTCDLSYDYIRINAEYRT